MKYYDPDDDSDGDDGVFRKAYKQLTSAKDVRVFAVAGSSVAKLESVFTSVVTSVKPSEAMERSEVASELHGRLTREAGTAAAACRSARGALLSAQPRLPDSDALAEATTRSTRCLEALAGIAEAL